MRLLSAIAAVSLLALALLAPSSRAGESDDTDALVRAVAKSRVSLADGIRQAEKAGGAAISAKYELKGKGELMLSVYVAEKGVETDAEHNVLKELIGSPTGYAWAPEIEVFADVPHVARSSQQLALMALSPRTLLALVERMERNELVISAIPLLRGRKALLVGRSITDGVVRDWTVDLLTSTFVARGDDGAVHVPVKRHEFVRQGEWVVEFGCAGVQDANGFVYFRVSESPRDIERVLIVNARGETLAAPAPKADRGGFYETKTGKSFGEPTELWIYFK